MLRWEKWVFDFVVRGGDRLPPRWQRWLAMFYPDARMRRIFWRKTHVEMDEGTFANLGMIVADDYTTGECLLRFGKRVSIAPHVTFVPYSLPNNSERMQRHRYVAEHLVQRKRIVIEDDAWIGAHVTVLPGVRIGRGAIIGAGAVVTQDVPPNSIAAGVPARVIRTLDPLPER